MNKLTLKELQGLIEETLKVGYPKILPEPQGLYEPIRYLLNIGGKRLRPALALFSCSLFTEDYSKAINAAIGLEVFHNFTLMHDDIMDKADLRRGKKTVHKVWDQNTGILSGDAMLIQAYEHIAKTPAAHLAKVLTVFNRTALQVCEGQQYDMEFETRQEVSKAEYLEMIRLKTSVLIAASLKIGAIIGGASAEDADNLYEFGEKLGLAFQLKDDWLDVYGDEAIFGKKIGGDIVSNKKTYLLISALEKALGPTEAELKNWLSKTNFERTKKVEAVKAIYTKLGVAHDAEEKMNEYYNISVKALDKLNVEPEKKEVLQKFADALVYRDK